MVDFEQVNTSWEQTPFMIPQERRLMERTKTIFRRTSKKSTSDRLLIDSQLEPLNLRTNVIARRCSGKKISEKFRKIHIIDKLSKSSLL